MLSEGLPLSDLPSILPTAIVCDAYSSLKQSFEFHRNSVFSECMIHWHSQYYYCKLVHIDKPLSTVHKSLSKQQANRDTSLVEELTSMDIRTQMILKRFSITIIYILLMVSGRLRELIDKFSETVPDVETVKGNESS